jgi:hypothetical protein
MLKSALSVRKDLLRNSGLVIHFLICNTYHRRTTDRAIDFLIGRKHSRKDRQVKVSFRELKLNIYWPTTDQKVRGSNPCGRTLIMSQNLIQGDQATLARDFAYPYFDLL